jgi:hypothetical protein
VKSPSLVLFAFSSNAAVLGKGALCVGGTLLCNVACTGDATCDTTSSRVFTSITLALSPFVLVLLPLSCWHLCPHAGATASNALASLLSRWHPCPSHAGASHAGVCLIAHSRHSADVLAGAALASLQASHWHHCWHCAGIGITLT